MEKSYSKTKINSTCIQINSHPQARIQNNVLQFQNIKVPCPRDDLESLFYILLHVITSGKFLPSQPNVKRQEKLKYYYEIKQRFVPERELKGYPEQFLQLYCRMENQFRFSKKYSKPGTLLFYSFSVAISKFIFTMMMFFWQTQFLNFGIIYTQLLFVVNKNANYYQKRPLAANVSFRKFLLY